MVDHTGRAVKKTGQESELYQSAQRFRNALISREDRAVLQMREIYGSAFNRLRRELAALDARLAEREAAGKPLADAALAMRDRLESLIAQTSQALKDSTFDAVGVVTDAQEQALDYVNQNTESLVMAATGSPSQAQVAISFDSLPKEALREFAGFSSDGSPLAVLFDSIAQDTPNALRLSLASGLAQGKNPRSMIREMLAIANISANRAETIARTEMIRASREGQRTIYESSPVVTGYRRVATQDARVCLACLALSGTLHKTAEIMPSHPNCRCVMVPVTPSLAEITGDPSIPDLRPGAITSDNILAGLDEKEIVGIMGPKRYQLFKDGTPLADMVSVRFDPKWGPTTRILPIKDIGQGPKPTPEPPTPTPEPTIPKVPRTPKPRTQAVPKQEFDNRDPEQVIAAMRQIAGLKPGETYDPMTIQAQLTELYKERFERKDAAAASSDPKLIEEFSKWELEVYKPELARLFEQAAARRKITKKHIAKMRNLLKSKTPVRYDKVEYDSVVMQTTTQVTVQQHKRKMYDNALQETMSFFDDRSFDNQVELEVGIDLRKFRLVIDTSDNSRAGYCEFTGKGLVAMNSRVVDENIQKQDFSERSAIRVLAHEATHWLHARSPNITKATNDFWERRTASDDWEASPYGGEYKRDKWRDAYSGQRYRFWEKKDLKGLEIPTRGIEYMLSDPLAFAEHDREYFDYVLRYVLGAN